MRYRLTLALVAVIALAGCLGGGGSTSDTPRPACNAENCVYYSDSGFSPERIVIQQGESVTWVSTGPDMWVASSIHPSHREYGVDAQGTPIFDQLGVGKRYTFQFNKTGTWKYHNHVLAAHTGTVVVRSGQQ
ncbi:MAG: hypothetical protein SVU32_06650 [Candidatus Nanohaloarchaea archaeon]|nr:hypothetical protein [Candidatus Nanohaloarchaea archaeon]